MNRRQFLTGVAMSTVAFAADDSRRARVAVSTWSFHNFFPNTKDEDLPAPAAPILALDFPEMIADRYQVHQLEIVAPHFESTQPSYLTELKGRLEKAHSHVVNIPVDIPELGRGGGLSGPDAKMRDAAIAGCIRWIDIGHQIDAKSVRCDPGKINPSDLSATVASYRKLADYAGSRGMHVLIENHGGVGSEHPEELVRIFKEVGSNLGALPDFGNFPNETIRQRGLRLLFPFAPTVPTPKDSSSMRMATRRISILPVAWLQRTKRVIEVSFRSRWKAGSSIRM